jgi:membrane protein implicated in regulation of membrane protease activity
VNSAKPFPLPETLLRAAVPLAALAALAVFAAQVLRAGGDPAAAAEARYLAFLSGAALLAVGFLAPAPALELGAGAALAVAAGWVLPPGPGRGAAVTLLLAALLAIAAARRLAHRRSGRPLDAPLALPPALPLETAVPLALGLQVLLRGQLLFQPQASLRTLVALLALPVAGAVAASLLARRHGGGPALAAAGTALLLAPGWNVAATLGLAALAAGDQLNRGDLGRIGKALALLVLATPIAWEPGPGLAAAAAGLALWRPQLALGLAVPLAGALLWAGRHGPAPDPVHGIALLFLLVPAALVPARRSGWAVATAVLLAAATPRIPDTSALAAPLALAALAVLSALAEAARAPWGAAMARRTGPAARTQQDGAVAVQAVWTGALLGGTALLASYPWLRTEPLEAALALAGLAPVGWRAAAAAVAAFLVLIAVLGAVPGRLRSRQGLAAAAAAAVFFAVFLHLPPAGLPLLPPESGVLLGADHPAWVAGFAAPRPVGGVVVESSLSGGAGLADGTPVATVRLRDDAGRSVLWVLRAGQGTGEWAARRPDVERTARLHSPPAFVSWVAGGFFGQRYRAGWTLPEAQPFTHLRIEVARGLPANVGLTLHQVEVRP